MLPVNEENLAETNRPGPPGTALLLDNIDGYGVASNLDIDLYLEARSETFSHFRIEIYNYEFTNNASSACERRFKWEETT